MLAEHGQLAVPKPRNRCWRSIPAHPLIGGSRRAMSEAADTSRIRGHRLAAARRGAADGGREARRCAGLFGAAHARADEGGAGGVNFSASLLPLAGEGGPAKRGRMRGDAVSRQSQVQAETSLIRPDFVAFLLPQAGEGSAHEVWAKTLAAPGRRPSRRARASCRARRSDAASGTPCPGSAGAPGRTRTSAAAAAAGRFPKTSSP